MVPHLHNIVNSGTIERESNDNIYKVIKRNNQAISEMLLPENLTTSDHFWMSYNYYGKLVNNMKDIIRRLDEFF